MEQYSYCRGIRRRRERKRQSVFVEVIAENFPNLGKEIVSQAMEVHRSLNTREPRETTPKYIIIKMAKIKGKDRVLKEAREREKITYRGKPIRLSSDFSAETLQVRREWHDIFNVMKQKQEYSIWQDYHLTLKEGSNNFQISKSESIYLPQTVSAVCLRWTAIDGSVPKAK